MAGPIPHMGGVTDAAIGILRTAWGPPQSNRASLLGHPCERYLVYARVASEFAEEPDEGLQRIFHLGDIYQREYRELIRRGLGPTRCEFVEEERTYYDRRTNISGHVDGILVLEDGERVAVEIKSLNPYTWERTVDYDDLLRGPAWLSRYASQLQLYLYLSECARGIFVLINKSSGEVRQFETALDYEAAEELLQKSERVNRAVMDYDAGKDDCLPKRINESATCSRCPYAAICCPDLGEASKLELLPEDELAPMIDEFMETKEPAKRHKSLKDALKRHLRGHPMAMVGRWLVEGKEISVKEAKQNPVRAAYTYWSWKATPVESPKEEPAEKQ